MKLNKLEQMVVDTISQHRPDLGTIQDIDRFEIAPDTYQYMFCFQRGRVAYQTGWDSLNIEIAPHELAFANYQPNEVRMSTQEMTALKAMLNGEMGICINGERKTHYAGAISATLSDGSKVTISATTLAGLPEKTRRILLKDALPSKRERQEFWKKINE